MSRSSSSACGKCSMLRSMLSDRLWKKCNFKWDFSAKVTHEFPTDFRDNLCSQIKRFFYIFALYSTGWCSMSCTKYLWRNDIFFVHCRSCLELKAICICLLGMVVQAGTLEAMLKTGNYPSFCIVLRLFYFSSLHNSIWNVFSYSKTVFPFAL